MNLENEYIPQCLCITDDDPCEEYRPGFKDGPCCVCGHYEECHETENVGAEHCSAQKEESALP